MVTLAQYLPILGGCGGTTLDRKMMAAGPIRSGSDGMIPGKGRKMTAPAKESERDDRNYDFAKREPIARYCGRESKTNNTYVAGRPRIGSTWWDVLDEKNR